MDRAVSSVFEVPEMSVEQRARRRGRKNAIGELHSEAKVRSYVIVKINTRLICSDKLLGPESRGAPAPA